VKKRAELCGKSTIVMQALRVIETKNPPLQNSGPDCSRVELIGKHTREKTLIRYRTMQKIFKQARPYHPYITLPARYPHKDAPACPFLRRKTRHCQSTLRAPGPPSQPKTRSRTRSALPTVPNSVRTCRRKNGSFHQNPVGFFRNYVNTTPCKGNRSL
jgi:hypothetical protein